MSCPVLCNTSTDNTVPSGRSLHLKIPLPVQWRRRAAKWILRVRCVDGKKYNWLIIFETPEWWRGPAEEVARWSATKSTGVNYVQSSAPLQSPSAQRSLRRRSDLRCAAIRSALGPTPDSGSTVIPAPETRGRKFQRVGVLVCNSSHHPKC
jgi:hypothetical protein